MRRRKIARGCAAVRHHRGPATCADPRLDFVGRIAQSIGMPEITFHSLRHTHASQLIDAGVDIATISKRLGHATPGITLSVYAHRFQQDDSKAAAAINAVIKW